LDLRKFAQLNKINNQRNKQIEMSKLLTAAVLCALLGEWIVLRMERNVVY
jgi:hypothetical protein